MGALFGGVLWAAVGALFARIVVYSAKTAAIYAGFAVVLLFLLWLYLSWLILLLGAQLSFYVQHPEHLRTGHADMPMTGALRERLAMSVMFLLGERFVDGGPRWTINGLADRLDVPGDGARRRRLRARGARPRARRRRTTRVAPARDLGAITLACDPRRDPPRDARSAPPGAAPGGSRRRGGEDRRRGAAREPAGPRRCATWCVPG